MKKALGIWYSRPRNGFHVSDITMCPRQKVFTAIDPKPNPLSDKQVHFFSSGKAIHEAIQSLFMSNRMRFEKEKYVEYEGIIGTVDLWDKKKQVCIELKTYRSDSISKPSSYHEQQLRYYMSMTNTSPGFIIYQLLTHKGDEPWKIFKIEMTKQERENQLAQLVNEINTLQIATRSKDPSKCRGIYDDYSMNWLCRDCKYVKECESMRPENDTTG